jgi:hypothetical protein
VHIYQQPNHTSSRLRLQVATCKHITHPLKPAPLTASLHSLSFLHGTFLPSAGHTDSKWRRRYCVLKGPRLFILRTSAALKPLAVLDLPGAAITASSTPLYPEDSPNGSPADSSDVLWVLRIQVQEGAARGGSRRSLNNSSSGRTVKFKIAAQTRELQVGWQADHLLTPYHRLEFLQDRHHTCAQDCMHALLCAGAVERCAASSSR